MMFFHSKNRRKCVCIVQEPLIKSKEKTWPFWLCLGVSVTITIGFYAIYGQRLMDSDQASELILANLLNQEGGILSENWYYSTELRVLNTQLVYRLGLTLFSDWHIATTFSLAVMLMLLVASYLFLAKVAGTLRTSIWTAMILALPFSRQYADYVLFGGYYIPHLTISFICVGLTLHLSSEWMHLPIWKKSMETFLLVTLCIVAGIGGIRALIICYVPMLVTAGGLLMLQFFNRSNGWGSRARTVFFSLLTLIAGLVGYRISEFLLTCGYSASAYSGAELQPLTIQGIHHMLAQTAWAIGWSGIPGKTLPQTVQSLLTLVLVLLIAVAFMRSCRNWRKLNETQQFLLVYFPVNCVLVLLACVLTGNFEARFMLPSVLYFTFVLQIGLEWTPLRWRKWACAALIACMIVNSTLILLKMDVWEESSVEKVSDWLVDNGYSRGFSTFWNSNIFTALSDNRIEMWTIVPSWMPEWSELKLYPWLQKKDHLEKLPQGRIFLLLTTHEDAADLPFSLGGREVYRCNGYTVYEYESAEKLYGTRKLTQ